ncbi:AAA family ATPase [Actinacidiphila glaucinigra]|uniref:AAA domain (Dynein-related subfamily) n=1 Tax=Actinacidiphila glaucinigra TaxID=235986 RepID=A0A239HKQ7_9ACTN|nr:MoxR family ATPase [Actinacidiphila glaucinigra]SNS80844.1 AAA domain (dynein-related subfamily) [Actinacidiphila glaucinigra]
MSEWLIYRGAGAPHDGIAELPPPPPWRDFDGAPLVPPPAPLDPGSERRLGVLRRQARYHRPGTHERELVNAALYLRRPLLVTGEPGSGKSTLAHSVAYELGLGRVLGWPIVSRSTLRDGLYQYDAIGRLQDLQIERSAGTSGAEDSAGGIGRYIRLGALGTALLPSSRPRVLLIDELDKSDIDLPNDLLNVLEEGEFTIPELERIADRAPEVAVRDDDGRIVTVRHGKIRCNAFPFIVLTSNGERDFPAPLMRRCIHLQIGVPDKERLAGMVRAHFGDEAAERYDSVIDSFLARSPGDVRAVDQLLNAIHLTQQAGWVDEDETRQRLTAELLRPLDRTR